MLLSAYCRCTFCPLESSPTAYSNKFACSSHGINTRCMSLRSVSRACRTVGHHSQFLLRLTAVLPTHVMSTVCRPLPHSLCICLQPVVHRALWHMMCRRAVLVCCIFCRLLHPCLLFFPFLDRDLKRKKKSTRRLLNCQKR